MDNFHFWLTLGTATIPAAITGSLSFFASWMKNRSDIKQIEKKHRNDLEKLETQYKHDLDKLEIQYQHNFETVEKYHIQELEKMKESHKLELENIQKHSETDVTNIVTKEMMAILGTALTPALSKHLENIDIFNLPKE